MTFVPNPDFNWQKLAKDAVAPIQRQVNDITERARQQVIAEYDGASVDDVAARYSELILAGVREIGMGKLTLDDAQVRSAAQEIVDAHAAADSDES